MNIEFVKICYFNLIYSYKFTSAYGDTTTEIVQVQDLKENYRIILNMLKAKHRDFLILKYDEYYTKKFY